MFSFDLAEPGKHVEQVELWLRGEGRPGGAVTPESVRSRLSAGALVAFTCVGDNARLERGFEVKEPVELDLQVSGEVTRSEIYDGARILDADTRRSVWVFERERSAAAGGADKNRRLTTTLRLNEGRYVAQYWSDDSHSCPGYLAAPPFDPFTWGLVIRPHDPARLASLTTFEYQDPFAHAVVASLTRVGDDESRSTGFALTRPLEVLVRAVGEGQGDQMFDYGWIVNADTRETVWAMGYRSTEPAGGAGKNRLAREPLTLAPGSYELHYTSDGSHAFGRWNDAPPFDPDAWGIGVFTASLPTVVEDPGTRR